MRHPTIYLLIAIPLLACSGLPAALAEPTPTPTSDITRFDVEVQVAASPTVRPPVVSHTPTPALFPTDTPLSSVLPSPAVTPALLPTQTARPVSTSPILPEAGVVELPSPPPPAVDPSAGIFNGNVTDQIVPLDPAPAYLLPAEMDQLEFKWKWLGDELRPCQLPDGFGFEVRLWPSPTNPGLSAAQRQAITPMGAIDAVKEREQIAANCDTKTGTRRYTVNYLKRTPGVAMAGSSGQFFWDVAYIKLDPYQVIMVSPQRDFFIPPATAETPTPAPTPSATPLFVLTPGPKPAGTISLLDPAGKPSFPANVGAVEFRWRWEGEGSPCQLPSDYGFELRIWSARPGFTPLGVFDAVSGQSLLACDPGNGVYSYRIPDLKRAAGVKATYVGEFRWDGQFLWDVALVSLRPYRPPDSAAPPGSFEISLGNYTGALDPFGEPLKCSDFTSWIEAQAVFLAAGGPAKDPHKMDSDGNQIACDELRQ